LLNLMMPKLDGYALIKQLNGWIPDSAYLPILVVTADTSRSARQKALSLGAKDFLTKPIDTAEATLRAYNLLLTR
jgi:CheY-like chemotaxis protein